MAEILGLFEQDAYDEIITRYVRKDHHFLTLKLNNAHFTLLLLAVMEKRMPLIQKIFENSMAPTKLLSQKDVYGNNALHLAALCQATDVVKFLLDRGANPILSNDVWLFFCLFFVFWLPSRSKNQQNGETALDIAKAAKNQALVNLLDGNLSGTASEKKTEVTAIIEKPAPKLELKLISPANSQKVAVEEEVEEEHPENIVDYSLSENIDDESGQEEDEIGDERPAITAQVFPPSAAIISQRVF